MGMFSGLNAEAYDRSYTDRALMARILKYFSAYRTRMILVSIATVAMALFGAANPLLVSDGVESLVNAQTDLYLFGLIVVVLLIGVLNWVGELGAAAADGRRSPAMRCWPCAAMPSMPRSNTTCRSTMNSRRARSSAASRRTRRSSRRW